MTEHIKAILTKFVEKLFDLDKLKFDKIQIRMDVIENMRDLSRQCYPKEFLGFLEGKIENNVLIIDKLMYQEFISNEYSAMPIFHFPQTFYGSAHSHPSNNNRPSNEDRQFFRKVGIINIIICSPFGINNIRYYNHNGEEINIEIID